MPHLKTLAVAFVGTCVSVAIIYRVKFIRDLVIPGPAASA
jgi:hypothetical protein